MNDVTKYPLVLGRQAEPEMASIRHGQKAPWPVSTDTTVTRDRL